MERLCEHGKTDAYVPFGSDTQCTRCGQAGHRASHCRWPACELPAVYYACEED